MGPRKSARDVLLAEVAAVTGATCGRNCGHHGFLICVRAAEHIGAGIAVDQHVALNDGEPVFFGDQCCENTG